MAASEGTHEGRRVLDWLVPTPVDWRPSALAQGCATPRLPQGIRWMPPLPSQEDGVPGKAIAQGERLAGEKVTLRLATLADCTPRYVAWLADPEVNRFLETRWKPQTLDSVRDFVAEMARSRENYLFAMEENATGLHVGNIKLGPICPHHRFAEIGFFVGEKGCWGKGYATEAVRLVTAFAFRRLGLHRVYAGLYASNRGSALALERAGLRREGVFRGELRRDDGVWDDHVWYGLLRDEWEADPPRTPR